LWYVGGRDLRRGGKTAISLLSSKNEVPES
jgi:hypothetical protein